MKGKVFSIALLLLINFLAIAQNTKNFFPEDKLMTVGTFYFPEHWPQSQWDRDFAKMNEMGFEYVHMGEFSWAMLEPEEGLYDFEWLDKAVELAAKHGLKVMLCTPTATTPVWMGIKYPEIYHIDENYQLGEHGSRQVNSNSNPIYRDFSAKIIHHLGKR
jgi:beta-galactosidase